MVGLGETHEMKLHTVGGLCILKDFFYILKGANLPLVFKLRGEICSVDSEENLPPDARF